MTSIRAILPKMLIEPSTKSCGQRPEERELPRRSHVQVRQLDELFQRVDRVPRLALERLMEGIDAVRGVAGGRLRTLEIRGGHDADQEVAVISTIQEEALEDHAFVPKRLERFLFAPHDFLGPLPHTVTGVGLEFDANRTCLHDGSYHAVGFVQRTSILRTAVQPARSGFVDESEEQRQPGVDRLELVRRDVPERLLHPSLVDRAHLVDEGIRRFDQPARPAC